MEKAIAFKREDSTLQRLVSNKLFWLLMFIFTFSYPIYRSINRELPPPLPVIAQVPEFTLTNEFNKPFGSGDLKGKAYIASFMFTSCPSTCPKLMEKMQVIQKRVKGLGTTVALVSFTVDPENDTPEVLFKHSRKYKAAPHIWSFLTAEHAEMKELVVKGFLVPMGEQEEFKGVLGAEDVTMYDIAHTERVVLVDKNGQIRGFYSTDKNDMNRLMIDLGLMINRS